METVYQEPIAKTSGNEYLTDESRHLAIEVSNIKRLCDALDMSDYYAITAHRKSAMGYITQTMMDDPADPNAFKIASKMLRDIHIGASADPDQLKIQTLECLERAARLISAIQEELYTRG